MLQRLLVPLDGSQRSECVLSLAVRIAQATHGTLLLVRVVDPDTRKPSTATRTEICEKSADLQQASAYLLETRQRLPAALSVQCISCSGPIVPTLLALAKGHAIDLILLCHRGETGIREMGKKSVTHHLACQSPLPLLVLHPDRPIPESAYPNPLHPLHTTEVMIALDGSPYTARTLFPALHLVAALTAPTRGMAHLVHILPKNDGTSHQEDAILARHYLQRLVTGLRQGFGERFNVEVVGSLIHEHDVRSGLVTVAEQGISVLHGGCELLALATHRRRSSSDWLDKSITGYVLERSILPLLMMPGSDEGLARGRNSIYVS